MNALWIIDLTESQNAIKAFYDSYWAAFLDNLKDPNYPDGKKEPWFYVATPDDLGLTISENDDTQTISDKISNAVKKGESLIDPLNGLIRYDFTSQNELNRTIVIVIGDIGTESTRRFFLPLATSLKVNTQQPQHWNITPNTYFYGMLYRREEVSHGSNLQDNEKAFLNQLHNMQKGWKTFDHVLFFEKPQSQRDEAIKSMALASLHLSFEDSHDDRVLKKYSNWTPIPTYLNAGVSGIYFEREVHNEREAFITGHTLLDAFVNSKESEFYDQDAAKERAENIPVFKNKELDEKNLYRKLSAQMPTLDTSDFEVEMPVKPGSMRIRQVWPRYFDRENGYIANVKAQLVNKVKLTLAIYEHEYLERLANNQLEWIKGQSKAVEDGIFGVFDDEHPDKHCSMHQAIEVAKQAEGLAAKQTKDVENIRLTGDDGLPIKPIPIPERYQKAYKTAKQNGENDTNKPLNELDRMLRRHPVFMFSMFSRALLMGIIMAALLMFVNPILAAVLFLLPFGIYFWKYRRYMNDLKSLQDRYIAISLESLNTKLLKQYRNAIHKSQSDICEYCKWNWESRLEMLRNNLGVLIPKKFHFEPFADFQPLLTDNLKIETKENIRKVVKIKTKENIRKDVKKDDIPTDDPSITSGKFNNIPLLQSTPNFDVRLSWTNNCKSVTELDNSDKQRLIYELMKQTADVPKRLEENLDPARMVMQTAGSITLMLDVSGSMCGEPLKDLKEAVKTLKENFGDNVRWVAFATEAKLDTEVNNSIDQAELECGGGTDYVPAFERLLKARDNGEIDLSKLVIISDGCPGDVNQSKKKVLELGCVVDVIYIGSGDQDFLQELAESTGGTMQQVNDIQDAKIETVVQDGIATGFRLGQSGNFPFGDLLRKSALKECMKALHIYTKDIMVTSSTSIETMVTDNGSNAGLINWMDKNAKTCTMNQGAVQNSTDILLKSSGIEQTRMCTKLHGIYNFFSADPADVSKYKLITPIQRIGDNTYTPNSPDILLTQLHIQPLKGISDLAWTIDANNDKQLENESRFDQLYRLYFGTQFIFTNIYNQPIA